MAYIRCPQCGQRALSVATTCPKCGFVLAQNPMQLGRESGLVACRACGKMIDRDTPVCPFCGRRAGRRRTVVMSVWAVGLILLAAGGVWGGLMLFGGNRPQVPAAVSSEAREPPAPVRAAPPPVTTRAESESIRTAVSDTSSSVADSARAVPRLPPVEAARPRAAQQSPESPVVAGRTTRWTVTWVNLREGRGTDFPVIRILLPRTRISVAEPRGGWWAVYEGGQRVGYIAGSELADSPPTGQPDSSGAAAGR